MQRYVSCSVGPIPIYRYWQKTDIILQSHTETETDTKTGRMIFTKTDTDTNEPLRILTKRYQYPNKTDDFCRNRYQFGYRAEDLNQCQTETDISVISEFIDNLPIFLLAVKNMD